MTSIKTTYIKETRFNSKMFKVNNYDKHKHYLIADFIKVFNGDYFIYIKDKHFHSKLIKNQSYKLQIFINEFRDRETGEMIEYIDYIEYKKIKNIPIKSKCLIDCSSDED